MKRTKIPASIREWFSSAGAKGGRVKSKAKREAAIKNMALARAALKKARSAAKRPRKD